MKRILLYISVLLFLGAGSVSAATYYVATTGNDANAGTISAPFRTIAKGFSVTGAGSTLYIRQGSYPENILSLPSGSSWTNPIRISSYPGETATIRAITSGSGSYVIFDDLIFDAAGALEQPIYLYGGANHLRFQNSEVKNGTFAGISTSPEFGPDTFHEFINLNLHHNGVRGNYDHGVYLETGKNLIDGGQYHHNAAYGIQLQRSANGGNIVRNATIYSNAVGGNGGGIVVNDDDNALVYNNVIYGHTQSCCAGIQISSSFNTKVYNNTVTGNSIGPAIFYYADNTISIRNNLVFNDGAITDYPQFPNSNVIQSNNFTSNPNFINASANNFHLQSTSGAINYGVILSEFTTDKDGNARVGNYDAGAYEYVSGGGGTTTLLGDINSDRIVNSLDWSLMSAKWLTADASADLNKDGAVNSLDWSIMSSNWLKTI